MKYIAWDALLLCCSVRILHLRSVAHLEEASLHRGHICQDMNFLISGLPGLYQACDQFHCEITELCNPPIT